MPFAPFHFFAAVKANVFPLPSRFDALTIDAASGGLGLAALTLTLQLPQRLHQPCPHPRTPPAFEIGVDHVPLAEVQRQHAPLTTRLKEVPNPIDDTPPVARRTPWAAWSPLPG